MGEGGGYVRSVPLGCLTQGNRTGAVNREANGAGAFCVIDNDQQFSLLLLLLKCIMRMEGMEGMEGKSPCGITVQPYSGLLFPRRASER